MSDTLVLDKLPKVRHRAAVRATVLYLLAIVHEFRWTLATLAGLLLIGATLYYFAPLHEFDHEKINFFTAMYGAWMAMLAQPITMPPQPWQITLIQGLYPLFGFLLIGEGVVRLALLLMSRRHGEKEWMRVMAKTYRDHTILCGLGKMGFRVFEQLLAANVDVIVVEVDPDNRFLAQTRATGACILIRDMKDDQSLLDAGIERASSIIVCTNDDMANLEVAMDSRRLNKNIRIILRLFDQDVAQKIAGAMTIDAAFSASALAAPIVAAMAMQNKVVRTTLIGGVPHVICELKIEPASPLAGKRIDEIEGSYSSRVLARTSSSGAVLSPPSSATTIESGDVLVVHSAATQVAALATAGRGRSTSTLS